MDTDPDSFSRNPRNPTTAKVKNQYHLKNRRAGHPPAYIYVWRLSVRYGAGTAFAYTSVVYTLRRGANGQQPRHEPRPQHTLSAARCINMWSVW